MGAVLESLLLRLLWGTKLKEYLISLVIVLDLKNTNKE